MRKQIIILIAFFIILPIVAKGVSLEMLPEFQPATLWKQTGNVIHRIGVYTKERADYFFSQDYKLEQEKSDGFLGTSVTTINGSDTLKDSRTTINNNFTALNDGKIENSTTTLPLLTTLTGLNTIGTITSGTWHGTPIEVAYNGTGTSSPSTYMVMLGNGSQGLTIASSTGTTGQFLTSNGAGAYPSWTTSSVDQGINYTWTGNNTNAGNELFTGDVTIDSTVISSTTVFSKFGGNGLDGDLHVTTGTTTLSTYKTYQYNDLTIDAGTTLAFDSNFQNKLVRIKVAGDLTLNGKINLQGLGGAGANGGNGDASGDGYTNVAGVNGSDSDDIFDALSHYGAGGAVGGNGAVSTEGSALTLTGVGKLYLQQESKLLWVVPGAGGGGGAGGRADTANGGGALGAAGTGGTVGVPPTVGADGGSSSAVGGGGGGGGSGAGGGALLIEVKGNVTFGSTSRIDVSGQAGANGGVGGADTGDNSLDGAGGGGGGGGSGGMFYIIYNGTQTDGGLTQVVNGGAAGANGADGGNGSAEATGGHGGGGGSYDGAGSSGAGADGTYLIEKNYNF